MAIIARITTWISGDTLTASALNGEFNNIVNDYNGGITNANISGSAAIAASKLTGVSTPSSSDTFTNKTISGASNTLTVREADLSISDNTTKYVTTSAHGFDPKAPNSTSQFLRGDASWATVSNLSSKIITATRDMTAATGSVSYTGAGFAPTAIIGIACLAVAGAQSSIGICDSSAAEANLSFAAVNEQGSSFFKISSGASVEQIATVTTLDADGFTLSWTKAGSPTGTANLAFICFR